MEDLFKHNMELYNKMLNNLTNYYKNYTKMIEKFIDPYNLTNKNIKNKVGTYPANGHEIYNYVSRYGMSNNQLQVIMRLDGKLDFDKLKQAVRLSVDVEPIFKCRFIEDNHPYWKPLENISMINFCSMEETDDIEQAIQNFIDCRIDIDKAPMLNIKLIRSEQGDTLGIKINHACCDGVGTREYVHLLAKIYTIIDQENGTFIPKPRIGGRKDQDRLLAELGITNLDLIFIPGSDIYVPKWPFPWEKSGSNIGCVSVCRLPHGHVEAISEYAKSKGATVNDFLLTAYYRAMLQIRQPIYGLPLEIPITVDLRRYLPDHKTRAIRNFSGSVSTKLIMSINEPFSATLRRVVKMMKEVKTGYPGLQSALGLERIEKINFNETLAYYQALSEAKRSDLFCPLYYGDKCVPTLSNLGYLSKSLIKFGDNTVVDAYALPPAVRAPGLLLVVNTYNSVLTLTIGYYKSTVDRENIERLLNKMKDELIDGCKS